MLVIRENKLSKQTSIHLQKRKLIWIIFNVGTYIPMKCGQNIQLDCSMCSEQRDQDLSNVSIAICNSFLYPSIFVFIYLHYISSQIVINCVVCLNIIFSPVDCVTAHWIAISVIHAFSNSNNQIEGWTNEESMRIGIHINVSVSLCLNEVNCFLVNLTHNLPDRIKKARAT